MLILLGLKIAAISLPLKFRLMLAAISSKDEEEEKFSSLSRLPISILRSNKHIKKAREIYGKCKV